MQGYRSTLIGLALAATAAHAEPPAPGTPQLQQFVIEREVPGASRMSADELRAGALKSNDVLRAMGADIQWLHSYVAGDKIYCVYNATSEALVREHAARGGFPINKVTPVAAVMTPLTANASR